MDIIQETNSVLYHNCTRKEIDSLVKTFRERNLTYHISFTGRLYDVRVMTLGNMLKEMINTLKD